MEAAAHAVETNTGVPNPKLGMWLFLASEVMFFTGVIGAYLVIRQAAPDWPDASKVLNIPLTALNTFILIMSSGTMVLAHAAATRGDQKALVQRLLATAGLGAIFLSIQAHEWSELLHHGLTTSSSLLGSCFYTMTGFHGAHVAGGVVTLVFVLQKAMRGKYSAANYHGVENAGLYWHFVDVVWIMLFTILYLL